MYVCFHSLVLDAETEIEFPSSSVDAPVVSEQALPASSKIKEKGAATVTATVQDPHAPDLVSSIDDDAEKPAGRAAANQKAKTSVESPAPVSKGVVMDRVGAILNKVPNLRPCTMICTETEPCEKQIA